MSDTQCKGCLMLSLRVFFLLNQFFCYQKKYVNQMNTKAKRNYVFLFLSNRHPPSPYLQKLPYSHARYGRYRRRPMSATVTGYRPSSGKPKIDAKFIADTNLWDPETPRDQRRLRPASAPIRRLR